MSAPSQGTSLVVVESSGKINKLQSILGKGYIVLASAGIFQDLDPNTMSIDIDNNFEPQYIITKPEIVTKLKAAMKKTSMLYIASDADREGEGIGMSIKDVLKPKQYKRITFKSVTKKTVLESIKQASDIDYDMVNAQKGRRVLDRLFGYLISPVLRKQIGGKSSAGRVQSPCVKLVVEKEDEIINFLEKNSNSSFYRVKGIFSAESDLKSTLYALPKIPDLKKPYTGKIAQIALVDDMDASNQNVITFLNACLKSSFTVHDVIAKMTTRSPSPPFTTSTLQQESFRKFGMSIENTMKNAQKLYEAGYITYMRTDSVEIPKETMPELKKVVIEQYGEDYYQEHIYKNKDQNAQEAHSAILPTKPELIDLAEKISDEFQIKLYKLIWQRTIASQMKHAKINVTTIQINISKIIDTKKTPFYYFQSQIDKVIFRGFMKVYVESVDDAEDQDTMTDFAGIIPTKGDVVVMKLIDAKQEYLRPPPRYTEASLVKKMEKLGIGRPATYAPSVKNIVEKEYITTGDNPGVKKNIYTYSIKSKKGKHVMDIDEVESTILIGKEKKRLIPTPVGRSIHEFMMQHFSEFIEYEFTAKMETDLDKIAKGKKVWQDVVNEFYQKIQPVVTELSKLKSIARANERILGNDKSGVEIFASKSKNGPYVAKKIDGKLVYANIDSPLELETIRLRDAIKLFEQKSEYPKLLGSFEDNDVLLKKGKTNFYIAHRSKTYSLPVDVSDITLKDAITLITEKKSNVLAEFVVKGGTATVLNGRNGLPYISFLKGKTRTFYPIPKYVVIEDLNKKLISELMVKPTVSAGSKTTKKTVTARKKRVSKKIT